MKLLHLALATCATVTLATACSSEEPLQQEGTDGTSSFTLRVPQQLTSRTFGDGTTAKTLHWAAYDVTDPTPFKADGAVVQNAFTYTSTYPTTTVNVKLVKGHQYAIVFWAQSDAAPYTCTLGDSGAKIEADYTNVASNDENLDAFYAIYRTNGSVAGAINETVTLFRPFGQVNFGTDDISCQAVESLLNNAQGTDAKTVADIETQLEATGVPTGFDLLTGDLLTDASGNVLTQDVTFQPAKIPAEAPVTGMFPDATYKYLSMNYIMVGNPANLGPANRSSITQLTLSFPNLSGVTPVKVSNVPVKSNYRTNIYGSLYTAPAEFNVVIDPVFEATPDDHDIDLNGVWDGSIRPGSIDWSGTAPVVNVTRPSHWAWICDVLSNLNAYATLAPAGHTINELLGATINIDCNMDLNGLEVPNIQTNFVRNDPSTWFHGTLDGQGHSVSNFTFNPKKAVAPNNPQDYTGLVNFLAPNSVIRDLTLRRGTAAVGSYSGMICGLSQGLIENCQIIDCNITCFHSYSHQAYTGPVGGLVGIYQYGQANGIVGCTVQGTTVTGDVQVGGLSGAGLQMNVNGNKVIDCNIYGSHSVGGLSGLQGILSAYSKNITNNEVRGSKIWISDKTKLPLQANYEETFNWFVGCGSVATDARTDNNGLLQHGNTQSGNTVYNMN